MKNFNDRPTFSRNMIRLRKERKITQTELAELTGLSKRMIAYYENEAVKPPIDKIETIAKVLNAVYVNIVTLFFKKIKQL